MIQVADDGENAIVLLAGANHEITRADIAVALSACPPGTLVLTQNETSQVPEVIEQAAARGLPVAFNPAPITSAVLDYPLDRVSILIVNESEGQDLTGSERPTEITAALRSRLPDAEVVVTLGPAGVIHDGKDGQIHMPACPVDVVDTTAAGDTFIGFFLAARLGGQNLADSLTIACRAAAITVSRPGAMDSIPTRGELSGKYPDRLTGEPAPATPLRSIG